ETAVRAGPAIVDLDAVLEHREEQRKRWVAGQINDIDRDPDRVGQLDGEADRVDRAPYHSDIDVRAGACVTPRSRAEQQRELDVAMRLEGSRESRPKQSALHEEPRVAQRLGRSEISDASKNQIPGEGSSPRIPS